MPPDLALKYYWLQWSSTPWNDTTKLAEIDWQDLDTAKTILPDRLELNAGQEPNKVTFTVKADSVEEHATNGVYWPIATRAEEFQRLPDGTDGVMGYPASDTMASPLKPFVPIRLMESADNTKADPKCRFMGILLSARLDLGKEEWTCIAFDLPRWRFTRLLTTGTVWQYENEADPTVVKYVARTMPVFNKNGLRNQHITATPGDLRFSHEDDRTFSEGAQVTWWRYGDMLNLLREMFWVLDDDDESLYGHPNVQDYIDWPFADAATYPDLFSDGEAVGEVSVGGMSLSAAIDCIICKAGYEWTTEWDETAGKYKLVIIPKIGTSNWALNRGTLWGSVPSGVSAPDFMSGEIGFDWFHCATKAKAFGQNNVMETTIACDPAGVMATFFPNVLEKDWTAADESAYINAMVDGDIATADRDCKDVFTRFKMKQDFQWESLLQVDTAFMGKREIVAELASREASGRHLVGRVYRLTTVSPEGVAALPQPITVSLHINKDLTFSILGKYSGDTLLTGASQELTDAQRRPRFFCDNDWALRPFMLTLAFLDDHLALGEYTSVPDGWPENLEVAVDQAPYQNEYRHSALHIVDVDGRPVEEDGVGGATLSPVGETIVYATSYLCKTAQKRVLDCARPRVESTIVIGADFNWLLLPGVQVRSMGGSGGLSTVYAYALITRVTFTGLGLSDSQRRQILECSNA